MEEKDLAYFKGLLIKWLNELLHHADYTVEGLLNVETNSADFLDWASIESDRSTNLRIRDAD